MRNVIAVPSRLEHAKHRLWVCPILNWTALDVGEYMATNAIRRNVVVDLLHRSGECLCGALAHPDELKQIEFWYPDVGRRIRAIEFACFKAGLPWRWGGAKRLQMPPAEQGVFELCQSCETRWADYDEVSKKQPGAAA
jgi:3'-phosphoadenosine 5'-phosphosulfate sulfotransferase (PAPS reductase)/FAD synthetase